jgi:teichuronic acid biosynthesis glycosyltransferase TuaG
MQDISTQYDNLVSIITPAYNSSKYISQTIESVLRQTYYLWELIIVDDYSTDNTTEIIRQFQQKDHRIKLIELESNGGVANARNVGIQNAKGRYLAFLDSDDIWLEQKLERQLTFMKSKDIAFSFTQYRQFVSDFEHCRKLNKIPKKLDFKGLLKGNVIACLTVIIDHQQITDISMTKVGHEDYILWLSILKRGFNAFGLNEDLARYRISNTSISGNKKRSSLWTWRIYRNTECLSLIRSIYYFGFYAIRGVLKHY